MVKNNIFCTKEQKGRIMRRLVEETRNYKRLLLDGIKIYFEDCQWVLCIPDSERELFHVNAEAKNRATAEELVKDFTSRIKKFQEN
jgi:mannose-1-phosphate guanylyltransferase/phosphomannomutase